jgi:hypothetical protein
MARLLKLLALPAAEFGLLFKAVFLLLAVRLALWLLPFRLQKNLFLNPDRAWPPGLPGCHFSPERIGWTVEVASRVIPRATCLVQALVARRLLTRAGHPAELRIGVVKNEHGLFQAHAWTKSGGKVIVGGHEPGYYTSLLALSKS